MSIPRIVSIGRHTTPGLLPPILGIPNQGASIALAKGDTIFFRAKGKDGKNATLSYVNDYFTFVFGANDSIAAGGNVMSLYDATCEQDTMTVNGFTYLLAGASQLVSVLELKLPATKLAVDCYCGLFSSCKALTQTPELPADSLAAQCYRSMFSSCYSLTQAPELKATKLATSCYNGMFGNCYSLETAPALPVTTLEPACYSYMFKNCTTLTKAPELLATTLPKQCYTYMFQGCTALTQAPELKATTLGDYCCNNMFKGCTALTQAPELPADTLAKSCYSYMFLNCTALTQAPELKAAKLDSACYASMFSGCSKLEVDTFSLICDGAELVVPDTTAAPKDWNKDMFTGCNGDAVGNIQLGGHYCIREYGKPLPPDMHDYFYLVGLNGNDTVRLNKSALGKNSDPSKLTATFEYSKDRINWTEYTWGTDKKTGAAIALAKGDTVFFRALGAKKDGKNATLSNYFATFFKFAFGVDDSIAAGGNPMSLYDASCEQDTMTAYGLCYLFKEAKQLVSAPKLPATKLAEGCYYGMFMKCSALTSAPALPATTLAKSCYLGMFLYCTALTQAPELKAATLAKSCYTNMFQGDTALIQAPELKAAKLDSACYASMFSGCTKLEVNTFSLSCDGAELVVPDTTAAPTNWNKDMFKGCHVNDSVKLNGHYCIKEYVAPYTREVTSGNYGTICLDKKFNAMEGVEGLYVPSYKDASKLYCSEVKLSDVVAGGAYIFKANADSVTFAFDGEAVAAAVNNDHMIGWLAADSTLSATFISDHAGYALLANNQIITPEAGSSILKNRAFIDLANVSTNPPSAAGRYIALGINEATGLENAECKIQNAECKMLVNGQLIIIKDGVKYNAMGQKME